MVTGGLIAALAGALTMLIGYLVGLATTSNDRAGLRWQIRQQADEISYLRNQLEQGTDPNAAAERSASFRQIHAHIEELKSHVDGLSVPTVLAPQQTSEIPSDIAVTIREVLRPLAERERLWLGLVRLRSDPRDRRDLASLLDKIAELGNFLTVLLSNEEGLPLASNRAAVHLDATTRIATRLTVLADQIAGVPGMAPEAILIRNAENETMLCRFFMSQGQRLALTAESTDPRLNATALEPAVERIASALQPLPVPHSEE